MFLPFFRAILHFSDLHILSFVIQIFILQNTICEQNATTSTFLLAPEITSAPDK